MKENKGYTRIRDVTDFVFFKNTPLVDFQNTMHFSDNADRDRFFLEEKPYETLNYTQRFNFIRDRSTIRIPQNVYTYDDLMGVNYCTFKSQFEESTRYYAYVIEIKYINDGTLELSLLPDGIMTFCQGRVLEDLDNLHVERQHVSRETYEENLSTLRTNGDTLPTTSKKYFYEDGVYFNELLVLMQCSADLTKPYGDEKNPKMTASSGGTFDKISSPVDLYMVEEKDFKAFTKGLSKYPWIAQNITQVILIPKAFFDENNFVKVKPAFDNFDRLYVIKDKGLSNENSLNELLDQITLSMDDLYNLMDLHNDFNQHLLNSDYLDIEAFTFDGQQLKIDIDSLPEEGLKWISEKVVGYENEIAIFPKEYKVSQFKKITRPNGDPVKNETSKWGGYLNNALFFKNFDSVPVLIKSGDLARARNANQRNLAESRLIGNRMKNIGNKDSDLKSRFMDAASVISNLNPGNLFGKFNEEYEYYREQEAEIADKQLETPTITEQNRSNSFQVNNGNFGITVKIAKPEYLEMEKIKHYYGAFGLSWDTYNTHLDDVESMEICNYVKFSGSWTMPGVDVSLIEMMKAQFESGVRLWHNWDFLPNPFNQNLANNDFISEGVLVDG